MEFEKEVVTQETKVIIKDRHREQKPLPTRREGRSLVPIMHRPSQKSKGEGTGKLL